MPNIPEKVPSFEELCERLRDGRPFNLKNQYQGKIEKFRDESDIPRLKAFWEEDGGEFILSEPGQ